MIEFIQANTSWIVLGVLFVLMMRMNGAGGMGCSGGHQHGQQDREPDQSERSLPEPRQEETGLQKEKEPLASGSRASLYQQFHHGRTDSPVQELPVLTKAMMMEHFDELVTDHPAAAQA